MVFISVKKILEKALKGNYAVGHFDVHNLEWMQATLLAAETTKSPVILGVTEDAVNYFNGYNVAKELGTVLMKAMNITVPVALHLDHGSTVDSCVRAIDAGFTSVMIDASRYAFHKNVEMTKEVVNYAHSRGVTVEAELGNIGGNEGSVTVDQPIYANVKECIQLLEQTNVDSLAPALGSAHGPYRGEPKVDFTKMKKISQAIKIPLVLHGASGLYSEQIKEAILSGTAKINVNADNHLSFTKSIREQFDLDKDLFDATTYLANGREAIKETIIEKMKLFGSINKG